MKHTRILALLLALAMVLALGGCCLATTDSETQQTTTTAGDESTAPSETVTTGAVESNPTDTPSTNTTSTGSKVTVQKPTSTTKQPSKNVVTVTTGWDTEEVTTTTRDKTSGKAIKILAVGNSFSVDAMQNHLYPMLESAGYTDITLGNLYIGGCSLDTHYSNLKNGTAAYTYYQNTDDEWKKMDGVAAGTAFASYKWDVVTIQQVSSDSGRPITYGNLQKTLDIIRQKEPQAKIYWHMTWAYQQNSDHWAFAHYNKDQMTMYNAITATVQEQVLTQSAIHGVIPSGTAIQNLRTSTLGDTLTSDGHHLKDSYGDYTAALTWFCTITGEKPEAVSYRPGTIDDHWDDIAKSVSNAVKTPYSVTAL